ncbi:MAG: NAD(P)-binding domain-containing protein [Thermoplasmata archaeon]|nr:NAD(P)-binding domain-containing protein [Thermoplasmata archaeon]
MKVGVIGSGDVGRTLGRGFAGAGHEVMIGSRSPNSEELRAWKKEAGAKASTGTFAETARHGEVLVLAVRGDVAESAIDLAGESHFAGKLLIDATNPLDFSKGMPPGLFVGTTDSLGERIQRKLPAAKVVKCFNIIGNVQMVHPKLPGGPPDMMICGNDAAAKLQTSETLKSLGWPGAIDVGGIDGARWLEALVPLWVRAGSALGVWDHGFKVLHK